MANSKSCLDAVSGFSVAGGLCRSKWLAANCSQNKTGRLLVCFSPAWRLQAFATTRLDAQGASRKWMATNLFTHYDANSRLLLQDRATETSADRPRPNRRTARV